MRRTLVLSVLAALLVASAAIAAKPQSASAELDQLGASGISGTADFKEGQDGSVSLHMKVSGLDPGETYEAVIYFAGASCGTGASNVQVTTFTANNGGKANFIIQDLPPTAVPAIAGSASVTVEQGLTQLACGEIVVQ